ncbi:tannase and feruloyl esterase [Aspergillus vadensis CBS 113365]|uniref:Carboxylic ester hydrolase n=1 Tax=Aspergillus vadensis (strain CBS 113365 / IMI 142717 / IBT 24658) TaxID=1448311 RepID=A0A319BHA5_ASPVC|nr:tannase and feruloyl esterase [Aspergillus vadensis CBS 113365]PYH72155.1 tannase and feruloyl esterase [Aspergillus vadensis CBS 113365]
MKKPAAATALLAGAGLANATLNCSTEAFQKIIPANASVVLAKRVAENGTFTPPAADTGFPDPAYQLPALCAVQIEMPTDADTTSNFGLFLPDTWKGRMVVSGNSAFSGVNYAEMGAGVTYGAVAMSTDTGHDSAFDNSWAKNPESIVDWGWRAMHLSIVEAKKVIAAYYGKPLDYSYYNGCSTGGRQGLKKIEAFPDDFDGAVVGAPAWWTTHLQLFNIYAAEYHLPENSTHHISSDLFELIANETLKQCDPQDGVKDNIISDPRRCNLNLETMLCPANTTTSDSNTCLTDAQLDTLYHYYNDWTVRRHGPRQRHSRQLRPLTLLQPRLKTHPLPGLADPSIPTGGSVYFYKQIQRTLRSKGIDLDDFYKFYLIPEMEHCGSTPSNMEAPWYIGGSSQASTIGSDGSGNHLHERKGFNDGKHDALLAMIGWVENGTDDLDYVVKQRPICPWPKQAMYIGNGSFWEADTWECEGLY